MASHQTASGDRLTSSGGREDLQPVDDPLMIRRMMKQTADHTGPKRVDPTRRAVVKALTDAAERYPDLDRRPLTRTGLSPRQGAFAQAIYAHVMRRWITLEYLLDRHLRQPMRSLEPTMRGVLLSGASQILFLDKVPLYAAIDESVELARALVRPKAAGLVNAVLRRLGESMARTCHEPWTPACDRLPVEDGHVVLREDCLPDPVRLDEHLMVATSHPKPLVQRWLDRFGAQRTIELCRHNTQLSPLIVAVESGARVGVTQEEGHGILEKQVQPHDVPGFGRWQGSHEQLVAFLSRHPHRRVQDPASAGPIQATEALTVRAAVDFCAGGGTKTRQLAQAHPTARVIAMEVHPQRLALLQQAFAQHPTVQVVAADTIHQHRPTDGLDLVVLDVPCSNSATLARRPEARYRFNRSTLNALVKLQQQIITRSVELFIRERQPHCHVLYSTCSMEEEENQAQTQWMRHTFGWTLVRECLTLPAGHEQSYHDGGYWALMKV